MTKRIHLIWKKYWLLIFELRKIRFQNLWGPRTIEVNKITMNLIPGKILKMFPHDSFVWFIIILTSNKDKKFQRKWKFEWIMRLNTVSTQILNFSDSNKRGNFENFLRNYFVVHLSAENSPENGPGRGHQVSRNVRTYWNEYKKCLGSIKSSLQLKVGSFSVYQ